MFGFLRQAGTISLLNLRNLPQRVGPTLVAVAGFAGVVLVFVGVFSIREGFRRTLESGGSPEVAVVLRGGARSEMASVLTREDVRVVSQAPGIARGPSGPVVSPEVLVLLDVARRSTGLGANAPFRGVLPAAFELRDEVRIVAGRTFKPGLDEVIVGIKAAEQFRGLGIGNRIDSGRHHWLVTGHFAAGGGLVESEIWTDARVLQQAYGRGPNFQVAYARLPSAAAFPAFRDRLMHDPRLDVTVQRESEFLASQSEILSTFITVAGGAIALLMGIGAIFGAINTMYITVAARSRELATLRAIGFGRAPVLAAVLAEGLVLGLAGGLAGGAVAYLVFNGFQASTLNFQSFSQVSFTFAVTPTLLVSGVQAALLMGVLGGLLPGIRAARMPIARALREL